MIGGGGRVLFCTQRDQLDCPPPNGSNHYLPLNKTGAHSTGERFRGHYGPLVINLDQGLYCFLRQTNHQGPYLEVLTWDPFGNFSM